MGANRRRRSYTADDWDVYSKWWRRYCTQRLIRFTKRATHRRERREGQAEVVEQEQDMWP